MSKEFYLYRTGTLRGVMMEYCIKADSPEEALEKYKKGDLWNCELINGDFQDDNQDDPCLEDFEEEQT